MGINQILNEIERPQAAVATPVPKTTKRKAEAEPQHNPTKVPRRSPYEDAPPRPTQSKQQASASLYRRSGRASQGPNTGSATLSLKHELPGKMSRTSTLSPPPPRRGSSPTRPVVGAATTVTPSERPQPGAAVPSMTSKALPVAKAPPKKGSYLEIMARAQAGHAKLGNMGKIQHKPLEKGPSKRERVELKAELARDAKRGSVRPGHGKKEVGSDDSVLRAGSIHAVQPQGRQGNKSEDGRQNGKGFQAGAAGDSKPKKAALATTGYQGTARPPSDGRGVAPGRTPVSLGSGDRSGNRPLPFTRPRRSRYEEEDEMDDFIDYDDDEPRQDGHEYGRSQKYGYSEDEDESDMEAGLSDIDQEERRTETKARQEDAEQAAIEARLKQQKDARKKALQKSAGIKQIR